MSSSSKDQKLSHISGAYTWRYTCLFMCAQHIAKPYSQLALDEVSVWSLEMKGGFKGVQRAMKGAGSLVTYTKCVYVHACLYIYICGICSYVHFFIQWETKRQRESGLRWVHKASQFQRSQKREASSLRCYAQVFRGLTIRDMVCVLLF